MQREVCRRVRPYRKLRGEWPEVGTILGGLFRRTVPSGVSAQYRTTVERELGPASCEGPRPGLSRRGTAALSALTICFRRCAAARPLAGC